MKSFFQELGLKQKDYIVYCDGQSAIDLRKNTIYHAKTKHINVRYHWIRKAIEEQLFQVRKIHINKNIIDMMTKVVTKEKLACQKFPPSADAWIWRGRFGGVHHI